LNLYETTFIVNPQAEESAIDEQVKAVGKVITDNGGKIIREERMGTRRFAYPIGKLSQGYYATILYESEPPVLPVLERFMKLGDAYIRHLTIRFEGDPTKSFADRAQIGFESDTRRVEGEEDDRRGFRNDRGGRGGRGGYRDGGRDDDSYNPRRRSYRD
jgi:small subunit ribosomal protein S6